MNKTTFSYLQQVFLALGLNFSRSSNQQFSPGNTLLFLRVVADVVGDLKMMALDMGSELSRQNDNLDRINEKVKFVV